MGEATGGDSHDLALTLGPALRRRVDDRLSAIEWFRSSWQHGGSATGFAVWRNDTGEESPVVVKLPIGECERVWSERLGREAARGGEAGSGSGSGSGFGVGMAPVARVFACGSELAGREISWVVLERVPGEPLAAGLDEEGIRDLLRAAALFHESAARCESPPGQGPPGPDFAQLIQRGRDLAHAQAIPECQRWNQVLHKVQKVLPLLRSRWEHRAINTWCHGDLHPGNVLRRPGAREGPCGGCVLIDLALVHAGHWVEDAVYLERQFWGAMGKLHGVKPVSFLAAVRRERGLPVDDHYADLANVRRVLMAASAPAVSDREGNGRYLHAALEMIEKLLPQASHA